MFKNALYQQEVLWMLVTGEVFKTMCEFEMVAIGIPVSAKWKKKS